MKEMFCWEISMMLWNLNCREWEAEEAEAVEGEAAERRDFVEEAEVALNGAKKEAEEEEKL